MPESCMIVLECKHIISSDVGNFNEEAYCHKCRDMKRVVEKHMDYVVRCTVCRYSRRFGGARVNAEYAMCRHAAKTGHTVVVVLGNMVITRMVPAVRGRVSQDHLPF